jgi:hypothetical protein
MELHMATVNRRDALLAVSAAGAFAAVGGSPSLSAATQKEKPLWEGHATADAKAVEKAYMEGKTGATERFTRQVPKLSVGLTPKAFGLPRPDLNGYRLILPNGGAVYLIDEGYRRWIPDPTTYNNLFRNWDGIVKDIDLNEIPETAPITHDAILAMPLENGAVYLIDNGKKRHIASPAVMDKYWFSWDRIYHVPHVLLDFILIGTTIS